MAGQGMGGGVALAGNGAGGALSGGLASPGQGIPGVSILSLLAQAAANAPALQQDEQKKKLLLQQQQQDLDTSKLQNENLKKQQASTQLNAILTYIKNNPALASDSSLIQQAKQLSKDSGIPLPLTMSGTPATPGQYSQGTIPGSSSAATPGGGAGDLGASDIGGTGGVGGTAPDVQTTQAPQAANAAGGQERIDVAALTPKKTYVEMSENPQWLEDASALSPEQRRSYYGYMTDAPEGFFTAPARPTTAQINGAVTIFRTMAAKGDARSIQAALQFVQKQYPGIDASMLVTPDVSDGANALEVRRINLLQQAGILKGDQVRQAMALSQARIQRMTLQNDYTTAATTNMGLRNSYFASDEARKASEARSIITTRAGQLKVAQDKLHQALAESNITNMRLAQHETKTTRDSLVQERDRLQQLASRIELSDTPDIPDPQDPTQTYTESIANQLAGINQQIANADTDLGIASDPATLTKGVQKSLGTGPGQVTNVSPGKYTYNTKPNAQGVTLGSNDNVNWFYTSGPQKGQPYQQ